MHHLVIFVHLLQMYEVYSIFVQLCSKSILSCKMAPVKLSITSSSAHSDSCLPNMDPVDPDRKASMQTSSLVTVLLSSHHLSKIHS